MKPFSKILVPTDFSAGAGHALELALELRRRYGATLTLFHAYQFPIAYSEPYTFSSDLIGAIERSARQALADAKRRTEERVREADGREQAPPIESKLVAGGAALAITEEAKAGGYDLIVMGTHGRTGLAHAFIGSVAERVVRTAHCPVLTVRGS